MGAFRGRNVGVPAYYLGPQGLHLEGEVMVGGSWLNPGWGLLGSLPKLGPEGPRLWSLAVGPPPPQSGALLPMPTATRVAPTYLFQMKVLFDERD